MTISYSTQVRQGSAAPGGSERLAIYSALFRLVRARLDMAVLRKLCLLYFYSCFIPSLVKKPSLYFNRIGKSSDFVYSQNVGFVLTSCCSECRGLTG